MLQPILKLRINIERDFDCGLNDVFEKRPAVVFIQDQIAGVTGESVARHIQLLLGAAAPSFIFMHDESSKAKPIKGLYDYLIDLSQPEANVLADIQDKLKLLLGPQWDQIYIAPKEQKNDDEVALALPEESLLIYPESQDNIISDIEPIDFDAPTTAFPLTDFGAIEMPFVESFEIISSTDDQLAEILSVNETAREQDEKDAAIAAEGIVSAEPLVFPLESTIPSAQIELSATLPESKVLPVDQAAVVEGKPMPVPALTATVVKTAPAVQKPYVAAPVVAEVPEQIQSPPIWPVDTIAVETPLPAEAASEQLQWAFEGEQRLKTSGWGWYHVVELLLVLCLLAGGWYLLKQKSQSTQSSAKKTTAAIVTAPVTAVQKPISTAKQPQAAALPSFIPLAGLDSSFAAQNPGWDRYVGAEAEYRLFRTEGKLRAVQVIALKDHSISDSVLKKILIELTGNEEYQVTSSDQKLGFKVLHATVNRKAELLIYRKSAAIHAAVVSLD